MSHDTPPPSQLAHLLLQHVLPLLSHLLHQQRKIWDPVSRLQLLQGGVQQTEGAGAPHPRAATRTGVLSKKG